jgi:AraC family transcriptional regulator, transcriptional activator of the genes for pyochelin and ferripyochelin receptors
MQLTSYDIECLYAARSMILADTTRHYTIQQIAVACKLSPTKLKMGFKMLFGSGLFEYFETARFEKSKEMMADHNKSLKQISKATGFKHQNNFSKAFKKRYGMTPKAWRKTFNTLLLFTSQFMRFLIKLASFATI